MQIFIVVILLYKLVVVFMGYADRIGGKKVGIDTNIKNISLNSEKERIETSEKPEKKMLVSIVASIIFVVALLYPAWTGFATIQNAPEVMYGSTILFMGWLGIIALYAPWYFLFPAIIIVRKITARIEGRMLTSRILLFLFWLEGFIAVVGFKWGGASDAGDFQITSIGPSFWMWTILVWYILISSYVYVNFSEDKIKSYTKWISIIAVTGSILIVAQYHVANLIS